MSATSVMTDLGARLEAAWRRSDQLLGLLEPAALYRRPIALRQPFIFYLGHLPAFGWNQVVRGLLGRDGFAPGLDELFARGIDPVGVDRYESEQASWPSYADVTGYRDRVRQGLREAFDDVESLAARDELAEHGRIFSLVIEHELMHHETLIYMMQQLDPGLLRRPADMAAYLTRGAAFPGRVSIPGGTVTLGAEWRAVPFGWDNEFPAHDVAVAGFTMDVAPVRNSDWLEFIAAGGYRRQQLWSPEGWAWRERVSHDHPAFWSRERATQPWRYRTLFDLLPLETVLDWPVFVSWAEADAYARWREAALPTEAEYHRAAGGVWWGDSASGNFDFQHWAPIPAGAGEPADTGVRDLVGNGWEWTATRFGPFAGFRAWARTYPGYSADFFDDHHYVMLGASWATDRALVRRSFRNWFQPHYPYVFAKFRTVNR